MSADGAKQFAQESLPGPTRHADAPSAARHARHLARYALLLRRKHAAEGGQHHVEAAIVERQILGIGDLEGDLQAIRLRA